MLKINKITIENFRGIKLPLVIDFIKSGNHTSVILYGRNGTGKSSIVDAWEWLNSFEILPLNREGVSCSDFPHRAAGGNNCYISVDFQHSLIKTIKTLFNTKKISVPILSGEYDEFKALSPYPNYLRYSDLQAFVFQTKSERYKYITKFFGLEKFSILQDSIQTSINKLTLTLQSYKKDLNNNFETINKIVKNDTVSESSVVDYLNTIGTKYEINKITQFNNSDELKSTLAKIISTNPVAKELSEWEAFQLKQNNFYPILNPQEKCLAFEFIFTELKKNEESIKQLILSDLYERSIEIIPKLENKTKCPVCDHIFEGDLLQHIKNKHDKLDILNKNKNAFEVNKLALEQYFESLSNKISTIQSESSNVIITNLKSFFDDLTKVNATLPKIISIVKKQLKDLDRIEISSNPAIKTIFDIIEKQSINEKVVKDRIAALSKDEKTKSLAQDYSNIDQIILNYKNYIVNKEKVEYLQDIKGKMDLFFSILTTYIQSTIQTTFSEISTDVVECFNELETSNPFIKNPEIKLITGKDKAVELGIEFVSDKISPAFKILSESQVNSFGLAIFLAAVKNFNREFKFFILDDVVNSFDSFKRPRVSQLIAKKFGDFQILILTHDQIFFDTIQRDFPAWQRYKFTSWDYISGPRFKLSQNYIEEIQEYINEDKPITAGQTLGRYLEWTLSIISENMQTPIRFKIENVYTLSEFYDPLIARFKLKLKKPDKNHKLNYAFDQLEQGTIFRNYCVHWKNEANSFTTPEIDTIFKKWLEIEHMIYCDKCKSFVKYENLKGTEYIKCNCSKRDLKADTYYF